MGVVPIPDKRKCSPELDYQLAFTVLPMHPYRSAGWDRSPRVFPDSPTLEALCRCSPTTRRRMRKTSSRQEYLSDNAIHNIICQTNEPTIWVHRAHPTTDIPTLYEDMMCTVPTAIRLLASMHLISYPRGLIYYVPPRINVKPEPWGNHPIMQSLLKRVTAKWRAHRDTMGLLPKPQQVQATPE
jgi:hypothetical protein